MFLTNTNFYFPSGGKVHSNLTLQVLKRFTLSFDAQFKERNWPYTFESNRSCLFHLFDLLKYTSILSETLILITLYMMEKCEYFQLINHRSSTYTFPRTSAVNI